MVRSWCLCTKTTGRVGFYIAISHKHQSNEDIWHYWPTHYSDKANQTWISKVIFLCLFVFSKWRWEVIAHCVDIGGIVDHHCLNFLFIINSYSISCVFNGEAGNTNLIVFVWPDQRLNPRPTEPETRTLTITSQMLSRMSNNFYMELKS
jgi:hypothetical protein